MQYIQFRAFFVKNQLTNLKFTFNILKLLCNSSLISFILSGLFHLNIFFFSSIDKALKAVLVGCERRIISINSIEIAVENFISIA